MPEETKQLLRQLHLDNTALRRDLGRLRVVALVLVAAVLAAAFFVWRFVDYSLCTTGRTKAITGPSSDRVTHLLDAFAVAAAGPAPLTDRQKAADLDSLDKSRHRYPQTPSRAKLAAGPDSQIVIWVDVSASLDAQAAYRAATERHPICSLWSV